MKKTTSVTLLVSILLTFTSCRDISAVDIMKDIERSDIQIEYDAKNTEKVNDFAVRLFSESIHTGENTLVSPISVLCAMAMTANGAKGDTLAEMEAVFGLDTDALSGFIRAYTDSLQGTDDCKVRLANSIWFTSDERFSVSESFLKTNADYFSADIYRAPFDDTTVKDINTWVNDKTDRMIPRIIDSIPSGAVMYLVNALSFDAEWNNVYFGHQVRKGNFTKADGTHLHVPFMYSEEYSYIEDENAVGFLKYYEGGDYAFAALLPKDDMTPSEYIGTLDGGSLTRLLSDIRTEAVMTAIPKFEYDYSAEMSGMLEKMGIASAFDADRADFSGIGSSTAGNIFINRVIHKTYISVGERGTRAGAATLVEAADGAMGFETEPKKVYLDRPFVFMVIDCEHGLPLFMGTVEDVG